MVELDASEHINFILDSFRLFLKHINESNKDLQERVKNKLEYISGTKAHRFKMGLSKCDQLCRQLIIAAEKLLSEDGALPDSHEHRTDTQTTTGTSAVDKQPEQEDSIMGPRSDSLTADRHDETMPSVVQDEAIDDESHGKRRSTRERTTRGTPVYTENVESNDETDIEVDQDHTPSDDKYEIYDGPNQQPKLTEVHLDKSAGHQEPDINATLTKQKPGRKTKHVWKCEECKIIFRSRDYMREHARTIHGKRKPRRNKNVSETAKDIDASIIHRQNTRKVSRKRTKQEYASSENDED